MNCFAVKDRFLSSVFSIEDAKLLHGVSNEYVKIPSMESRNEKLLSYVNNNFRCREYESVISIEHSWPMNGISRESEKGTACQLPDGRWKIVDSSS